MRTRSLRTTFISLAACACTAWALWFFLYQHSSKIQRQQAQSWNPFYLSSKAVSRIDLTTPHQTSSLLLHEGVWSVVSPVHAKADTTAVESLLKTLKTTHLSAIPTHTLHPAEGLQKYGLQPPSVIITWDHSDKTSLWIGSRHPMGAGVYVWNPQTHVLGVADHAFAFHATKTFADFRINTVTHTALSHLSSVQFSHPQTSYSLQRTSQGKYLLTAPIQTEADHQQVQNIWEGLVSLRAMQWIEPSDPVYPTLLQRLTSSKINIRLKSVEGEEEILHIERDPSDKDTLDPLYHIHSSTKVSIAAGRFQWLWQKMAVPAEALQNLHTTDFLPQDIHQITLQNPEGSFVLQKQKTDSSAVQWAFGSSQKMAHTAEILAFLHTLHKTVYQKPPHPCKETSAPHAWRSVSLTNAEGRVVLNMAFAPPQQGGVVVIDWLKKVTGVVSDEALTPLWWESATYRAPS
jgi:hypothetical protein